MMLNKLCVEMCEDEGPADKEFSIVLRSKHIDRCCALFEQAVGTADLHKDCVGLCGFGGFGGEEYV